MSDNIDAKLQLEIAACYHLGKLNPLKAEWMAEYGIGTEEELIEEETEELVPVVRKTSRDLPQVARERGGWV